MPGPRSPRVVAVTPAVRAEVVRLTRSTNTAAPGRCTASPPSTLGADRCTAAPPRASARRNAAPSWRTEDLDRALAPAITTVHLNSDTVSVHHGTDVRRRLARHPRFVLHFTPVHCSWMNQVEQWFSILRRKRLRHPDFTDLDDLAAKLAQVIDQWNAVAHPFRWTAASFQDLWTWYPLTSPHRRADRANELPTAG